MFHLGIGIEYIKESDEIRTYIKGNTGIQLDFTLNTAVQFDASIGPITARVEADVHVDNYGDPLSLRFGLDDNLNYIIGNNPTSPVEDGFTVTTFSGLTNAVDITISGQISGSLTASFREFPGSATLEFIIADINNAINNNPGAAAITYAISSINLPEFPSVIGLFLSDPRGIIESVDDIFRQANEMSLGRQGIVTKFKSPFIGAEISRSMNAGSSENFLERSRRTIVGELEAILNSQPESDTVAEVIAGALSDLLDPVLQERINVTYYENGPNGTQPLESFNSNKDIKSFMFTIPFGKEQ